MTLERDFGRTDSFDRCLGLSRRRELPACSERGKRQRGRGERRHHAPLHESVPFSTEFVLLCILPSHCHVPLKPNSRPRHGRTSEGLKPGHGALSGGSRWSVVCVPGTSWSFTLRRGRKTSCSMPPGGLWGTSWYDTGFLVYHLHVLPSPTRKHCCYATIWDTHHRCDVLTHVLRTPTTRLERGCFMLRAHLLSN